MNVDPPGGKRKRPSPNRYSDVNRDFMAGMRNLGDTPLSTDMVDGPFGQPPAPQAPGGAQPYEHAALGGGERGAMPNGMYGADRKPALMPEEGIEGPGAAGFFMPDGSLPQAGPDWMDPGYDPGRMAPTQPVGPPQPGHMADAIAGATAPQQAHASMDMPPNDWYEQLLARIGAMMMMQQG